MPDITKGPSWTWQETFGDVVRSTPLIDDQKNIYITTVAGRVYKFTVDGKVLWTYYTGSKGTVSGSPSLFDSAMLFLTRKGFLVVLDLETGKEILAPQIAPQVATSADCNLVTQKKLIVAVTDPVPMKQSRDPNAHYTVENNRILALSLEDGSLQWSFAPYRTTFNFQASTIHDGSFVFQDTAGGVYRVSTADGRLMWYSKTPDRESGTTGAAVLRDGRVFAVSSIGSGPMIEYTKEGKGLLHVYNYEDGRLLWTQDLPYEGNQAVAVGEIAGFPGKNSLILGTGRNPGLPTIVRIAFSLPDIHLALLFLPIQWLSVRFPSWFAQKQKRSIVALDAATGNVLWYHELEPYQQPAAAGDAENMGRRFMAMTDGTNPNNEPLCLPDSNAQPVIDGAGTAFVPFQDGKVYILRDENGDGKISAEEIKEHLVGSAFQAVPAMAPGLFVLVDCSGRLEVFREP